MPNAKFKVELNIQTFVWYDTRLLNLAQTWFSSSIDTVAHWIKIKDMLSTANSWRGHRLGLCSDRTRMLIHIKMEDQMLLRDSWVVCRTEYCRFLRSSIHRFLFFVRMEQLKRRTDILKSLNYYMKQKRLSRFLRDLKIIQKVVTLIKWLLW